MRFFIGVHEIYDILIKTFRDLPLYFMQYWGLAQVYNFRFSRTMI